MILVVDASVALKWFVIEDWRPEARRLLETDYDLEAPDLIVAEVANAAWKKVRQRQIGPAQAARMVEGLPRYLGRQRPSADLAVAALGLALDLGHPVYDCFYLACAQQAESRLVTADDRLCRAVAGTGHAHLVEHIGNFP